MDSSSSVTAGGADLQTVLDRMADGVFAVDADWEITYANDTAREMIRAAMADDVLGSVDTIDGLHFWEALPDAVDTTFYDKYHEAMETGETVAFEEHYEPLGTWFDVRVFPSDSGLSVYVRDVTEQRRLEQQRRESFRALQKLYAVSSDRDRTFEEKVEALLELGCEYLGIPNGFLTRIEQGTQYVERSVATHPELQPGQSCPLDEAYCKRTIELDRLLTVVDATDEGWEDDPAYERFGLGTYIGGRVEIDDELYGTLCFADTDQRGEAFTDTQRTFVELLTRWVSYELERQQARSQLQRERDRLEGFASVVSHDLRNPLQIAMGRVDLLAETVESEHVPPIERALSRMDSLIEDLLTLAREGVQVEDLTTVDLAALAREAWETTDTADGTLIVEPEVFRIDADESRLRQLLENLFRNAADHGSDDVTVTVGGFRDRRGFFVADDGPGIPPEEREAIFDAGYTTTDDGTGFGLSIVSEIATAHGWEIAVTESEAGGTRFEFSGVEAASS